MNKPMLNSPGLFAPVLPTKAVLDSFPTTRYQGSKRRLLAPLQDAFCTLPAGRALDLFSGTATVSLLLKSMGWAVTANDFLHYNRLTAELLLSDCHKAISASEIYKDLKYLLESAKISSTPFVAKNFSGIYFTDEENLQIDRFCQNLMSFEGHKKKMYQYSVGQALLMKRPYNLFHRANLNMRLRSVSRSFGNVKTWNTPIIDHACKIASRLLRLPSTAYGHNHQFCSFNTMNLSEISADFDLVYLDPPYMNKAGQGIDYSNFYHFLEGLCDYSLFSQFDDKYPHRPIVTKPSAWLSHEGANEELRRFVTKWSASTIVLSYRSDGKPTFEEIMGILDQSGRAVKILGSHDFKYALSSRDDTKEIIILLSPE